MKKSKDVIIVFIIIVLSYFSIRPVLSNGFFPMHDDTQVGRVIAMGRALSEGQFPVRWVADLGYGYGYPIFNFYGPLPYYIGGFFYILGFSGLVSTKIMFIIGIISAGISMYLVTKSYFGKLGALVASVFYMYAPYHAVQIYVRGSVGEFWILVFWPLLLYGLLNKSVLVGAIGLAGAILSHTLLGYATILFLLLGIGIYLIFDRRFFKSQLLIIFLGLGISSFFWLPAFTENIYTSVRSQISWSANYADHFVCLEQLWSPIRAFGGSAPGCADGMSFAIGKLHLILGMIAVLLMKFRKKKGFILLFTGITLFGIFLVLPVSRGFWMFLPNFSYMQYPWRFLTLIIIGTSLLCGSLMWYVKGVQNRIIVALLLIVSVITLNQKWFSPQYIYQKDSNEYESREELRWRVSKISDEYLPSAIKRPQALSEVIFDTIPQYTGLTIVPLEEKSIYGRYQVISTNARFLKINKADFPGWAYVVNEKRVSPSIVDGLPMISIPNGISVVEMRLTDTPIRAVGNILSVASIVVLIYFYGRKRITVS